MTKHYYPKKKIAGLLKRGAAFKCPSCVFGESEQIRKQRDKRNKRLKRGGKKLKQHEKCDKMSK